MTKSFLIIIFLAVVLTSCKEPESAEKHRNYDHDCEIAETTADSLETENQSSDSILQKDFIIPSLTDLLKDQKVTSSSCNAFEGLYFENDSDYSFGKYHLYSDSVQSVIGEIYVRYKDEPWQQNNSDQEVLAIFIEHETFKLDDLEISIGDLGMKFKESFSKAQNEPTGYSVCLKSSIINARSPLNHINRIAIIRSEGFLASCSHEFYVF